MTSTFDRQATAEFVFKDFGRGRFTLDGPAVISVWEAFGVNRNRTVNTSIPEDHLVEVLLTPHKEVDGSALAAALNMQIARLFPGATVFMSVTPNLVLAKLTLEQMVVALLPLSPQWRELMGAHNSTAASFLHQVSINRKAYLA